MVFFDPPWCPNIQDTPEMIWAELIYLVPIMLGLTGPNPGF